MCFVSALPPHLLPLPLNTKNVLKKACSPPPRPHPYPILSNIKNTPETSYFWCLASFRSTPPRTLTMRQKQHVFGVWWPPLPPIHSNIKNTPKTAHFCVCWFPFLVHSPLPNPLSLPSLPYTPSLSLSLSILSLSFLSSHSLLLPLFPFSVSSLSRCYALRQLTQSCWDKRINCRSGCHVTRRRLVNDKSYSKD